MVGGISFAGLATSAAAQDATSNERAENDDQPNQQNEPGNDTGADDGSPTETQGEEPNDEPPAEDETQGEPTATITITDHTTEGSTVTVSSVTMSEGGFVSIHDYRRFQGQVLGSIIGITDYLPPGTHTNVTVPLFTANATAPGPGRGQNASGLTETQDLIAIPHQDGNGSGAFDGEPDPAYENGPRTLDQFPVVNDIATVSVAGSSSGSDESQAGPGTQQPP